MNITEKNETRLQELLDAAYPPATPSDALQERLRLEAGRVSLPVSRPVWPRFAMGFASFAVTAAILIVAVLMVRKDADAQTLNSIYGAIASVRQAHLVDWLVPADGRNVYLGEAWVDNDRSRTVIVGNDSKAPDSREIRIRNGASEWTWSSATNAIVSNDSQSAVPPINAMPLALVAAARSGNSQIDVRLLDDSDLDGRLMHRIAVTSPTDEHQTVIWVDPETDLPSREDIQFQSRGQMIALRVNYDYQTPMPASLFDPAHLSGAQVVGGPPLSTEDRSGYRADGLPDLPAPQVVAITGMYWAGDPAIGWLEQNQTPTPGITPADIYVSVDAPADMWVQSSFINAAAPAFTLVSPGLPDVPVTYNGYTVEAIDGANKFVGFGAIIADQDRAKLEPGATYSLEVLNSNDAYQFEVANDAQITVPEK